MTNYNDGKWHGWNGGECPVHPESIIDEIGLKTGVRKGRRAGTIAWFMTEDDCPNPVIAFRVIKEHKEPREFWSIRGVIFPTKDRAESVAERYGHPITEIIHVREVIE